ncbi:tetratricopeptide repeat protein [Rubrivirga sp. S365]|uniref:Tetratricopeptide repeat protein n=1 Tax=Rubrivirga litoralis TaxID=3075598 RepID=A0ABU3BQZ8_9BACT|nr:MULTISPECIES: tetratricopeptide repeat protein [unclassified Rubrivirga]MDT0631714.1 tetratricopeptide repeat protein [Rubrivirga sp. F394]MDT7856122.1 tetratricopeptide repeat protein [Rubrivirga sp. S365]
MRRPALAVIALAGVLLAAPGCRPGTALGNRYNNFRAFYNTYYNASRSLEEGEEALQNDAAVVDRTELLRVFPVVAAGGAGGGPFEDAVEKSADLLRDRPTSKWADDALLVIGKAYFYQRNFAGAEQKFEETAAAAQATGDRRLGDEAQFWLGRTYAATERYDEGVAVLQDGLARDDVDRRWRPRMRLALGELYALAGRWDEAAEVLREGAAEVDDGDLAARAYVLLGQVEEYAERYDRAAEAYTAALDQQPAFELGYAAAVSRALVVGLDAGKTDEALALVDRMEGDDKFYERRGELALVRARLLAAAGRTAAAEARFRDVLYDPDLDGQRVRGEAHYRLGEFYRDALDDYVRASAHFDTAATALREPPLEVRPSRAAVVGIGQQARTYAALAETARRVSEADSLLALGALSDDAFAARIESIEAERLRVFQDQQRRLEAERAAQAFSGEGTRFEGDSPGGPAVAQAPVGGADVGFLSYRNPGTIQAGLVAFEQRWGSRPLVPNWRRLSDVRATALASDVGGVADNIAGPRTTLGQGPPPLDIARVPRTLAKLQELNTELAQLRYELANAFFLSAGRADTAAALYRAILTETPDLPTAVRARYALAEIERGAGREDAARPLYEEVIAAAPTSDLARASRVRLGLEDDRPAPTLRTAAETSAAYDAARAQWRDGAPREAAAAFVALADADPDSASAARAYLAAAAAIATWADGDAALLTGPLPADLVSPVLRRAPRAPDAPPRPAPFEDEREDNDRSSFEPEPGFEDEPDPADEERPFADIPAVAEAPAPVGGEEPEARLRPQRRAADSLTVPEPLAPPAERPRDTAPPAIVPAPPPVGSGRGGVDPSGSSFTLRDHLRAIVALYPRTVYAERAQAMQDALSAPPAGDPPAGPLPAAAPPAAVDGAPAVEPFEDEEPVADEEPTDASPPEDAGEALPELRGTAPIDPAAGGVALRLRTLSVATEGAALERGLRRGGFRAATVTDGDAFYVVVGQFETAGAAEAARDALPPWAQEGAEVVELDDFSVVPRDEGGAGDLRP